MEQIAIKIRFKTACLGGQKPPGSTLARFERSGGHVIFMPTWWKEIVAYGAKGASPSFSVELAERVGFDAAVDGQVKRYTRHYTYKGTHGCQEHEAFLVDQVIGIRAMLPDGMTRDDLFRILQTAGAFKGISPYGKDTLGFGRFEVVEIQSIRADLTPERSISHADHDKT